MSDQDNSNFSSDEDDSSSSSSSFFSHSSSASSLSQRDLFPILRQRRRNTVSNVPTSIDDDCQRETLYRKQRKIIKQSHWSSCFLGIAIGIWFVIHAWEVYNPTTEDNVAPSQTISRIRPPKNFWSTTNTNNITQTRKNKKNMEDMPEGCHFPYHWQTTSFPDCNRLHEIDLKQHLQLRHKQPESLEYYIHSGLWRDVFSIRPDFKTSVVIKLMKPEHDMDPRNLDRHRRDALTMERLTASPNVVDIYGFCGNTVLTEQAIIGLDRRVQQGNLSIHQKIRISLDAARGLAALHDLDILHADIQTQQFLVDATGTVKINDFNRGRFLPRNASLQICPIQIPSAPGLWRSPEEYTGQSLIQAMDVYSLGNVLHEVLVGKRPFQDLGATHLKRKIQNGVHPEIITDNPWASRLAALIQECLEHDVDKRISAFNLVRELEVLMDESNKAFISER